MLRCFIRTGENIVNILDKELKGTDVFWVDVHVKPGNVVNVYVDNKKGITIDKCIEISRKLEKHFNRDIEDFELNVSSPGLHMPLKKKIQYEKNIGRNVEVLFKNGIKDKGKLTDVAEDRFKIKVNKKIKEGNKNKKIEEVKEIKYNDVKHTKIIVDI